MSATATVVVALLWAFIILRAFGLLILVLSALAHALNGHPLAYRRRSP
ncbi:MAG: hypothetical protein ACYC66_06025 [Chloroflexota bacterium]